MPAMFIVNAPGSSATIGFFDANGNSVSPPAEAAVAFSSSNKNVATVAPDANNAMKCDITLNPDMTAYGTTEISAVITGATDVNGEPYVVGSIIMNYTPAQAAQVTYQQTADAVISS